MIKSIRFPKVNLSVKLLLILVGALVFGNFLPEIVKAFFYAISLSLKEILLFVLPAIIFSGLFSCLLSFQGNKAIGVVLGLFAIVCVSNYLSTLIAYGVASFTLVNIDLNLVKDVSTHINELAPSWNFTLPTWLSNQHALFLGFAFGCVFSFYKAPWALRFSIHSKRFVTIFLEKIFIPLLPFFALGFILKIQHEGILGHIIQSYLPLILILTITLFIYLMLLFIVAAGFNRSRFLGYLKNVVPVALTGFSTMSSMATLPVTLKAAEKNTANVDMARLVVPATVNIHLMGVSIGIPFMALAILLSFGYEFPSFLSYAEFAFAFIIAQLAIAGVPGGAILVMLPLLESAFGFSGEMSALITALYILFDSFITLTNVLGNSALAIIISKLFAKLSLSSSSTTSVTENNETV